MNSPRSAATAPLYEQVQQLLREDQTGSLQDLLGKTEPVDLAHAISLFGSQEQHTLLQLMDNASAAELLSLLNESTLTALLALTEDPLVRRLLMLLEPDDATQVIACLEPGRAATMVASLEPEVRKDLETLLSYNEDTAGRIMDPHLVRVGIHQTVGQALVDIRRYVAQVELDEFFAIYVVNEQGVLVGAIPTWRMLLALPQSPVAELMSAAVIKVQATLDQEEVSRLVRNHDLVSVPVVDHHQRLLGRITVDDVVDVIHEEFTEDMAHFAGTGGEGPIHSSIRQSIRDRAPWLLFALVGLYFSALVMRQFEGFFVTIPQLAFFVPLVMAMGGNAGIQSSSLIIRGLATGEVQPGQYWRRTSRELAVGLGMGLLFSTIIVGAAGLLTADWPLGFTVAVATAAGITVAAVIGATIPMALKRIDLDPALATGPFLTTLNDIIGIVVYLGVAFFVLF